MLCLQIDLIGAIAILALIYTGISIVQCLTPLVQLIPWWNYNMLPILEIIRGLRKIQHHIVDKQSWIFLTAWYTELIEERINISFTTNVNAPNSVTSK